MAHLWTEDLKKMYFNVELEWTILPIAIAMLYGILKYDTLKTLPNSSDLEQVRASFIGLCSGWHPSEKSSK